MSTWPPLPEPSRRPVAAWTRDTERPYALAARPVILPPFQRAWAWSAERVCEYLQGLFEDVPQTPLALWRPDFRGPQIVLDGQHRLAALGADVPGRVCPPVRFDLHRLCWEPGEADPAADTLPPSTVIGRDFLDRLDRDAYDADQDRYLHIAHVCAAHRARYVPIVECRSPETPDAWRDAYDYFASLNRSVPFTEAELSAFDAYVNARETP